MSTTEKFESQSPIVSPFHFEGSEVRVVLRDREPWWVGNDVCGALGIANSRDALARLDDDERDAVGIPDAIGRSQETTVISESGLYSLILRSRVDGAKRFKRWVTHEVLPSIRKTGSYVAPVREVTAIERERRLLEREVRLRRQVELEERKLACSGLTMFLELAGNRITDEARHAVAAKIAEHSTGTVLPMLMPANHEPDWLSPSQIAEKAGTTANAVGRAISALGLRGKDGFSKAVTNVAPGTHRPVLSYLYSPAAVDLILDKLGAN